MQKITGNTYRVHGSSREARGLPGELDPAPEGGHRPVQATEVHHLPQVHKSSTQKKREHAKRIFYENSG